jgi:isopentenyl-diphosphate delta-isomerase
VTDFVELVTPDGLAIGSSTVDSAHDAPGRLHRAFSVLLFDPRGRTLLQQRAAVKTRFPSRWANTCCGHPRPGEPVIGAAARRLTEELGVRGVQLDEAGVYAYEAGDPVTGRVEHEYDHVLVGRVASDLLLDPDPGEVAATRWEPVPGLLERLRAEPARYAPWLSGVLAIAEQSGLARE